MLFAIDPKYKTVDGKDFKSILLYNNSGGSLKLTKNNIATPQKAMENKKLNKVFKKRKQYLKRELSLSTIT